MSGWEKSPDYGTPEPPRWFWALIIAGILLVIGLALFARFSGSGDG